MILAGYMSSVFSVWNYFPTKDLNSQEGPEIFNKTIVCKLYHPENDHNLLQCLVSVRTIVWVYN